VSVSDTPAKNNETALNLFSVSQLTKNIKSLLEEEFPFIWIYGEISNIRIPGSGHCYFTLKDDRSQVAAVIFRGQLARLPFVPQAGMEIIGLGRISVYEPRGSYQFIFEKMEPAGVGALQLAFEQLRNRLKEEGLFDEERKKPLPFLPARIAVVTSSSGSVVHDILRVIGRRYPGMPVRVLPVRVQGDGSEEEIRRALFLANRDRVADVIILARGGGSLEDLQPFNSEIVARAIADSELPVISAIGHETDTTISDFVADRRASTPSVAAELAVPEYDALSEVCSQYRSRLFTAAAAVVRRHRVELNHTARSLRSPASKLQDRRLHLDDLSQRLCRAADRLFRKKAECRAAVADRLFRQNPSHRVLAIREQLDHLTARLRFGMAGSIEHSRRLLGVLSARHEALSPIAILSRGYSIARHIRDGKVIKVTDDINIDNNFELIVNNGTLICRVERIDKHDGQNEFRNPVEKA